MPQLESESAESRVFQLCLALSVACPRRMSERKAASLRKAIGAVEGESSGIPASVDQLWRIARQGRRQVTLHSMAVYVRQNKTALFNINNALTVF